MFPCWACPLGVAPAMVSVISRAQGSAPVVLERVDERFGDGGRVDVQANRALRELWNVQHLMHGLGGADHRWPTPVKFEGVRRRQPAMVFILLHDPETLKAQ